MANVCRRDGTPLDAKYRCKECNRKRKQEIREGDRELARQKDKDWYYKNLEKARERRRSVSTEKRKEYNFRAYRKNKIPYYEANARRRARVLGAEGAHTAEEWKELCAGFNYMCVACYSQTKLTKDHIIPLSLGGNNYIDNIQPLCGPCNSRKNATIKDYMYWFMVA